MRNLKIQKWGNSLAVRIPASFARSVGFKEGQPVEISLETPGLKVSPVGERKLTLAQKLKLFDAELHGGEAMASRPVGSEIF